MTDPVVTSGAPDPNLPVTPEAEVKTTTTEHVDPATGDETVTVDTEFFNQQESKFGRLPSADGYLDELEAEQAEITRAAIEGREPDLENPAATAGQPLVPAAQLPETSLTSVGYSTSADQEDAPVAVEPASVLPVAPNPDAAPEAASVDAAASGANNPENSIDTTHSDQTADEDAARNDGITTPTNSAETTDQSTEQDQANADLAADDNAAPSLPAAETTDAANSDAVDEVPAEVVTPTGVTIPPVNPESAGA